MTFTDTFLKYHNAGINWKCPSCGTTMGAVMEVCTLKCKGVKRPFEIEWVVYTTYFDGVEEKWKSLRF